LGGVVACQFHDQRFFDLEIGKVFSCRIPLVDYCKMKLLR
jgi:hypothetical protein